MLHHSHRLAMISNLQNTSRNYPQACIASRIIIILTRILVHANQNVNKLHSGQVTAAAAHVIAGLSKKIKKIKAT